MSDDNTIIKGQIKRLEQRLERSKIAYMDGADTLDEYKENKKSIEEEIKELKYMLETIVEEEPEEEVQLDEKELRRLTEILSDSKVSNTDKNKMVRTIFKEIIKGGKDGKRLSFIFWKH